MGLKNWLVKNFLGLDPDLVKKMAVASDPERAIDAYLATSLKENQDTLRMAQKLLKGKTIEMQTKAVMDRMQSLESDPDEDEDEDEGEDYNENSLDREIINILKQPLLNKLKAAQIPTTAAAILPSSLSELSPLKSKVINQLSGLSDAEIEKILKKL